MERLLPTTPPSRAVTRCAVALAALAVVPACTAEPVPDAALHVADSAGVRITTIAVPPAELPEWTVEERPLLQIAGAGEGDSAAFGQVGAVRWLASGGLVVADAMAHRLLVFDGDGRFVQAHGGEGDGPGELRGVGSVTPMAADSFAVFDSGRRRLGVWHATGGFARAVHLGESTSEETWAMDGWPWRDTGLVVLHLSTGDLAERPRPGGEPRRWALRAWLTVHDASGASVGRSADFDAQYTAVHAQGDVQVPFSPRPFVAVDGERVLHGSGARFALHALDARLAPVGELRWPLQREPLVAAEADSVRAAVLTRMADRIPPEQLAPRVAPAFAPSMLPADRPAINRVLVADDGRLWVERFAPTSLGSPLPPASERWTVLEPDGRPVARVRLPAGARLEAVREGRVALVVHDELDVQRVAVFALRTGAR